ncbi:hypothetical protein DRN44_05190 [Thermococci archaeon]|nr:MAG: hypothetical protein DRN44_05190 [Thermococci archaeon]
MGLREWILGPYAKDLEELKSEVKTLTKDYQDMLKELLKIQKSLEDKADKKPWRGSWKVYPNWS